MTILVTGAAGFIGSKLTQKLLIEGHEVLGVDNLNDYYSPELKKARLHSLMGEKGFTFQNVDIADENPINRIIKETRPNFIYHLAAQAGVRLPLGSFRRYIDSNLTGFANVAVAAAEHKVSNMLYASSSSVYGDSTKFPYTESALGLKQTSFYGASKYTNEILAESLSGLSDTKFRGMRFFTVYGPMGRPDMAYFRLLNCALNNKEFHLFGDGTIRRDFTYVDDVIKSIMLLGNELNRRVKHFSDVVNVGGGKPHSMTELIECINMVTGREVRIILEDSAKSDVKETIADDKRQIELTGFIPNISLMEGIERVFKWASEPEVRNKLEKWVG